MVGREFVLSPRNKKKSRRLWRVLSVGCYELCWRYQCIRLCGKTRRGKELLDASSGTFSHAVTYRITLCRLVTYARRYKQLAHDSYAESHRLYTREQNVTGQGQTSSSTPIQIQ